MVTMKKYVIAQDQKQLSENLDYINVKYYGHRQKMKQHSKWETVVFAFRHLFGSVQYNSMDKSLCELYVDEIELFFCNNYFENKSLLLEKAYLLKNQENGIGIKLPIFLSIIASVAYTYLNDVFMKEINSNMIRPFVEACKKFFEVMVKHPSLVNEFKMIINIGFRLIVLLLLIVFVAIGIIWTVNLFIKLFVIVLGEMNFTKKVVGEYEIILLEKLCQQDEYKKYLKTIELLENLERNFSGPIEALTYNYVLVTKKEISTIDSSVDELQNKLLCNPIIMNLDEKILICGKKIIVKSLIHRVYLKLDGKTKKIYLKGDKLYLRK